MSRILTMIKIWYHFTDRKNLPSILREGLCPRGDRPANDHGPGLDSNPKYVYLTSRRLRPWHCMNYDDTCVLVIYDRCLNESLKRPDEDEAKFGMTGTTAYEGVISPDDIEEVWFYEARYNEQGVLSYVMIEQDFHDWEIW